jgi:exodeoxyribonuclease VII small subunit
MAEDEAAADLAGVSFEKALAELEDIVGKLEKGNVPLEESSAR